MVATLTEAFENYNNYDSKYEQQIIESYFTFINSNVEYPIYKKMPCINNNKKPVFMKPWLITRNFAIVFVLPDGLPRVKINSVLPSYMVNKQTGHYNTEICGSLKAFTFKAYKLLYETINKYKNDPTASFFAPNNYIDLEQGWHKVDWKPVPPPPPSCSKSGGPCGPGHPGESCCKGLTCEGGFYGTCTK